MMNYFCLQVQVLIDYGDGKSALVDGGMMMPESYPFSSRLEVLCENGALEYAFRASRLPDGPERDAAIKATWQHPFPGNVVYRLGRRHVRLAHPHAYRNSPLQHSQRLAARNAAPRPWRNRRFLFVQLWHSRAKLSRSALLQ